MSKEKEPAGKVNTPASPQPKEIMAKKYQWKAVNGKEVKERKDVPGFPSKVVITNVHLSGPRSEMFAKAIKNGAKRAKNNGFFEQFIEEVK